MLSTKKLFVALMTLFISSCTLLQHRSTGVIPLTDTPQSGYTRLSDHFAIEVARGNTDARRITFYYIDDAKREKSTIGANYLQAYESRQGSFAISEDGNVLLFIHNELTLKSEKNKISGLYEYRYGVGEKLLEVNARSGAYIDEKLPDNTIVFQRTSCPEVFCIGSPTIVRSTDGKEYVWINLPDKIPVPQ